MARQKKQASGGVGQGWLMTFSDMVTLLLCFFVLLNIMSTLDVEKFKQLMMNLRGTPDIFDSMDYTKKIGSSGVQTAPDISADMFSDPSDWWAMLGQDLIGKVSGGSGDPGDDPGAGAPGGPPFTEIDIVVTEGFIIIRCQGEVLFDTLRDTLKSEGVEALSWILDHLVMPPWEEGKVSELHIEGHADARQIPAGNPIRSNRLLSAMRAEAAFNFVVANYAIPDSRIGIAGWGSTHPIDGDFGDSGDLQRDNEQWSKNRRVEFILYRNFAFDEQGRTYDKVS